MSENSDGNKDLVELSRRLCDERKQLESGVADQDRRRHIVLSEREIKCERERARSASANRPALPHQASQATTVCWERFLHLRSLKVLLVESDDSTRHVIAALLQNCSYEVVEAADGLQAWKILEDITNPIDIVLTEVVMPCLSGVALLYKITSHKTRNKIPVIMMSSHDSVGLVFKCLSKGAVDFLVKPLRKNELKNLWQHVWRRCHSSSGSGSESATHTIKSVKPRSADKSDNGSGSNDEEDNGSPSLNFGDGSDHGSGTQNSWTKQAVEDQIESSQEVSAMKETNECPDSTCAQVIHPNMNLFEEKVATRGATKCEELREQPEKSEVDKTLANLPKSPDSQLKSPVEVPMELSRMNPSSMPNIDSSHFSSPVNNEIDLNSGNPTTELNAKTAGIFPAPTVLPKETKESDTNKYPKIPITDVSTVDHEEDLTIPDKCLKRVRGGNQETRKKVQDDRNVLRRSGSSAFSRYNAALHNKNSSMDARSLSPLENGMDGKPEVIHNMQSYSGSNIPNQCSNGGGIYIDMSHMTSTSNNNYVDTVLKKDKSSEIETAENVHPPPAKHVNQSSEPMLDSHEDGAPMKLNAQPTHQELQMQPGSLNHNHHPTDNLHLQRQPPNHDNFLPTKVVGSSQHCQRSNMTGRHIERTAGNYSLNGSGSGSNHGSNGQNGSNSAANVGGTNVETYDGLGCKSGSGSGDASGSGNGSGSRIGNMLDPDKLAQREAALTKYRQKRKELCFKRKVRYQSRKTLAEQRPRVRGQFVKQTLPESTSKDTTDSET